MFEKSIAETNDEVLALDETETRIQELSNSELDAVSGGRWVYCLTGACDADGGRVWID